MYIEILEQRVEAHIKIPHIVPLNLDKKLFTKLGITKMAQIKEEDKR